MSTIEIILAVISSSVISALLTSLVNWKLHNSNYKKEYYKKILEKRLSAFEIVQSISGKMSFQAEAEKDDYATPSICYNEEFYNGFIYLLATGIDSSFWLDDETTSKLTEINVFLFNNISNKIPEHLTPQKRTEKYQQLGHANFEHIRKFRKELQYLVRKELRHLHRIDSFFKRTNKGSVKSYLIDKT